MTVPIRCALAALALLTSACPDRVAPPTLASCGKAYEQCTLGQGVLGVCDPVDCQPDQTAPCFVCRPQH